MPEENSNKVIINYEELVPGFEFAPVSYELSASLISQYLKAVDNSTELDTFKEFVPPLAISACAMAAMSGMLSLPPGSIHISQELEFFKLIPIGSRVSCRAKVTRKLNRKRLHILVLELNIFDQDKEKVQRGEATIMLPA
jgi:hypothetical protein